MGTPTPYLKRYHIYQSNFQSIRNLQEVPLPQENEYGTPDKPTQIADELRTVQDAHSRGEISSTAPSIETPLDAHGETSSTSPWFTYKRIYDLRLGNDFYVTVAEVSPGVSLLSHYTHTYI